LLKKTRKFSEERYVSNPLLTIFESLFVDWWLMWLFSVLYTPCSFSLSKPMQAATETLLRNKGLNLSDHLGTSVGLGALKDAEVTFATKTPLRFLFLGVVLFFIGGLVSAYSSSMAGSVSFARPLGVIICLGSIWNYFRGRWELYRLTRLLLG